MRRGTSHNEDEKKKTTILEVRLDENTNFIDSVRRRTAAKGGSMVENCGPYILQ